MVNPFSPDNQPLGRDTVFELAFRRGEQYHLAALTQPECTEVLTKLLEASPRELRVKIALEVLRTLSDSELLANIGQLFLARRANDA